MTPHEFLSKWRNVDLKERTASQSHFNDLCHLIGVDDPISSDPKGEWFTFEKGATKTSGGEGWADVWRKGCFAWEYKGKAANLDKAFDQLLRYSIALESPPLLIVSDMERIRIHTNWTNTVQQVREITLEQLTNAANRDLLRACFLDPEALRPTKTRQMLTEEAARQFAALAQRLRSRGYEAHDVAHFVIRLIFCMFAEDVGLLPDKMFQRMLEVSRKAPGQFAGHAATLFGAMRTGGMVGFEKIEWFNGGLFDDDTALPLEAEDIANLLAAAKMDWSEIDPSILGTLFERGLDPDKRSQLGAHYTDRDKIMMIVRPVVMEPLAYEWTEVKAGIEATLAKASSTKGGTRTKARGEADKIMAAWRERLRRFRVLDPACGSGNFLYLSLLVLKDIEHRANLEAYQLGLALAFPQVGPENVLGIEINPYAAELARVSVWIGEIQWMRRNGFDASRNPILRTLDNIDCRDALLTEGGARARWPDADAVVGNPPFLGAKWMLDRLGTSYTHQLRGLLPNKAPASDLVTFWFDQAARAVEGRTKHVGFVATNMIRSPANSAIAGQLYEKAPICFAQSDDPWVVDGADVRVSLVVCSTEFIGQAILDGRPVVAISPDLKALQVDLRMKRKLRENKKRAVRGVEKGGPFDLKGALARQLLSQPTNPNGRKNDDVIKRYVTVSDIVGRGQDEWIVDFSGLTMAEACVFEAPFKEIKAAVLEARSGNRDPRQLQNWWLFRRTGEQAKKVLVGKNRVLVTGLVTKHRIFRWMDVSMIPDTRVILIDGDSDVLFGILSSKFHEIWTLMTCQFHGVGNDPVYTPGDCFETFPFPEGLTPDLPSVQYATDPRAIGVAAVAARLNELRENWLNPPDLVRREPEVAPGYPDRILPISPAASKELTKRTLTNLYNIRPEWLDHAHRKLDEAVAEAYGWGKDFRDGALTDDEIIARLFRLNQERAS
ncbi:MAG: N-6 DNA methylase [Acidocella sp.]|nr:N-6 DNA methylase [Acidocella sp.]